ncbi:MAG: universal stress protein [Gammaproteobacteria bacterium]|nr:universal stress protein [Gammaproteobacteria bacterium]
MSKYKKVLMALDFHADNAEIITTAAETAKNEDAELSIIHVMQTIGVAYNEEAMTHWSNQLGSLEENMRQESRRQMSEVAERLDMAQENCYLREGSPAHEIHELVKEVGFDLIVVGTHGRSGLKLLLGSTANSVLHGATCDVLAVRIYDE